MAKKQDKPVDAMAELEKLELLAKSTREALFRKLGSDSVIVIMLKNKYAEQVSFRGNKDVTIKLVRDMTRFIEPPAPPVSPIYTYPGGGVIGVGATNSMCTG